MWSSVVSNAPHLLPFGSLFHLYQIRNQNKEIKKLALTCPYLISVWNNNRDIGNKPSTWFNPDKPACMPYVDAPAREVFRQRDISTSWAGLGGVIRVIIGLALVRIVSEADSRLSEKLIIPALLLTSEAAFHLLLTMYQGSKGSRAKLNVSMSSPPFRLW